MEDTNIKIHNDKDMKFMRKAGKLASDVLNYIEGYIEEGITTEELNRLCHDFIISNNAIPAPLNYDGFPKSVCISVNNVVCHGIPGAYELRNGDILNIDVTVILDGWHGDTSRMFFVGEISENAKNLINVTKEAMMVGIEQVKPGVPFNSIGYAIEKYINKANKKYSTRYSCVRDFCGHGIGRVFHDEPQILHYKSDYLKDVTMQEGMFFTIEPMINEGSWRVKILADEWTSITSDGKLSAQYEHTIAVTKDGYEIFT